MLGKDRTESLLLGMHIYFSGIGGAGIGPLALIAKQAGYEVSGSDASDSSYISYLKSKGISNIHIGQTAKQIAKIHAEKPIDWLVYSSALPKTTPEHPELVFCRDNKIKATKRDELLNQIIADKDLSLVAVAGTHGKTTTTAMAVWLFKQLGVPVSYSVGAKLSFGDMGEFDSESRYFIYEADEYDHNFLSFRPYLSIISGVDWDHPDIYPTREEYNQAFKDFIGQSKRTFMWSGDANKLALQPSGSLTILDQDDSAIHGELTLPGQVNREDAWIVMEALKETLGLYDKNLLGIMNKFPGLSRRFEKIAENIYADYAHTPGKIRGALQLAHEVAGEKVVVVYEGLHNTRQHFIKDELASLFDNVKEIYIVPSYLAREDPGLKILEPADLVNLLSEKSRQHTHAMSLNDELRSEITKQAEAGNLVLCLSAGGAGSLDEWLRQEFGA